MFADLPSVHRERLEAVAAQVQADPRFEALLLAGSAAAGQADEWSDLDLVIVCAPEAWPAVLDARQQFARDCGPLLSAFTGEHVGEPRLLICLYGPPLLHVDLKFVTPEAVAARVDDPRVLLDKTGDATRALAASRALYPAPEPDWIEDRFWTWVHYAATKIGRGEMFDALEMLGYLRCRVLGPLALQAVGATPNGVRRIERLAPAWAGELAATVAQPTPQSAGAALRKSIDLYRRLRPADAGAASQVEAEARRFLEAVLACG